MTQDVLIRSDKFLLRPFTENDVEIKVSWLNDPEIKKTLILKDEISVKTTLEWFNNSRADPTRKDFIIETNGGEIIGTIGLRKISEQQRSACIYIIIGNKAYWGKGVMFETERMLITWAFKEAGLEKIWAHVRSSNIASVITMKKLGFKCNVDSDADQDVLYLTLSMQGFRL
jgi:Acetyltransferases, including N-acetylases of ribosomal proteins